MKNLPEARPRLFLLLRYYFLGVFVAGFSLFAVKGLLDFFQSSAEDASKLNSSVATSETGTAQTKEQLRGEQDGQVLPFFGERKVLETTNTQEFPGSISVKGGTIFVYDAGGTDYMAFRHDGTDANLDFSNTTDLNIPKNLSLTGYLDMSTQSVPSAITGRTYFDGSAMKFYDGAAWQSMSGGTSLWTDAAGYINPTTATGFRIADTTGNLTVPGTISEGGTALSSKYLGISAKAADANTLDSIDSSGFVSTTYNTSLNSDSRNSRGVTRLYRREHDSDYSVQTYWTGYYWHLDGYGGDTYHAGVQVAYADSAGNADTTDGMHMNSNSGPTFGALYFYGVGGNSGQSAPTSDYRIYQAPGAWTNPYPDLNIAYHTGISIGASYYYGGTRFFSNSDMVTQLFSVGDGDYNVRIYYNLIKPADSLYINAAGAGAGVVVQTGGTDKFAVTSAGMLWQTGTGCGGIVPQGMIGMFDSGCPSGWTEVTNFRNMFPKGHDANGTYCESTCAYDKQWFTYVGGPYRSCMPETAIGGIACSGYCAGITEFCNLTLSHTYTKDFLDYGSASLTCEYWEGYVMTGGEFNYSRSHQCIDITESCKHVTLPYREVVFCKKD